MYYEITKSEDEISSNNPFYLHSHTHYEIYLFLEGDAKYVVEEKSYSLEPYDIIVIKKHEMHRVYHNNPARYRRFVLSVSHEFFEENNCLEYERSFTDFANNRGNKICGDVVRSSGLYNAFMRLEKYTDNFTAQNTTIEKAIIIEILYLINSIHTFSLSDALQSPIKKVITYINNHYTENISLDCLEKKFFISKYHLCRMFKQATGLTVHGYITDKRLNLACELKSNGATLSVAADRAGFASYSAFYRAYLQRFGKSPKTSQENENDL